MTTPSQPAPTRPPTQLGQIVREWAPVAVMLIGALVWMVNGQNTAERVSHDLRRLERTTEQRSDKLADALGKLTAEVGRLATEQAEARAERRALQRSLQRVEARCCGGG